jgi:putative glutamine amidotransferase
MIAIGVTDTMISEDKYQSYISWLNTSRTQIEYHRLSYMADNPKDLDRCNALLLTGGNDVDPALYSELAGSPKIKGVDPVRDSFERKLLDSAMMRCIPVLGICRGLQLVNVHYGGTLIPDLEDAGFTMHRNKSGDDQWHDVVIDESSGLRKIIGEKKVIVNSFHHQAVDKVGSGLKVTARTDDGIVEAMELIEKNDSQFFTLLQWHPERMKFEDYPSSKNILTAFINKVNETIQ